MATSVASRSAGSFRVTGEGVVARTAAGSAWPDEHVGATSAPSAPVPRSCRCDGAGARVAIVVVRPSSATALPSATVPRWQILPNGPSPLNIIAVRRSVAMIRRADP